jgi:acetyl-CoA carboxylase carboxyl transferase beta subunit
MAFLKRRRFVGVIGRKSHVPDGLWTKCDGCANTVLRAELEESFEVCPSCGHHYRLGARRRIESVVDEGSFEETHTGIETGDPLSFDVGKESYPQRIERAKRDSGLNEALVTGFAKIESAALVLGVMDSRFIMGSMGSALGEKICRAAGDAIEKLTPLVLFAASGGARMQEGILALMQMAKTADAVRAMNEAGVPYISVLTDPTTGGVYASFASLGDIILAEPRATIGFAGKRVMEGALRVKAPEGWQTAEYQFEHGFVDRIVNRGEMRSTLGRLVRYLAPQ